MRVLIINPPWPGKGYGTRSQNRIIKHRSDKFLQYPIFLAYSASQIKDAGHNVFYIDSVIHSEVSDLVFLLSHNGTTDTLVIQGEVSGNNIFNCILTDAASINLEEGESPYGGSYKPHNPLSVFFGTDPDGQWMLTVKDIIEYRKAVEVN